MKRVLPMLFALIWLLAGMPVRAADPCSSLLAQADANDAATRIAAVACKENQAWFRAFIDADGRSNGLAVYEAENDALADGIPAWKKVATYWSDSGLRASCATAAAACRSFVVDTPWSAAFISWVMRKARVPGFVGSSRHVDYVRAAWRAAPGSAYRLAAPDETAATTGDMLCYVRANARVLGYHGLLARLDDGGELAMHCDIVVAAEADGMAWLIGGNVQQAVTLRMLRLDAQGRFTDLPSRDAGDPPCSPDARLRCNLNRQDWVALLKLQPELRQALSIAKAR